VSIWYNYNIITEIEKNVKMGRVF